MASTHLVIPDSHAHYQFNNDRAVWLGKLIVDVKPDVVINIGDGPDMPSLASYDYGRFASVGRTYNQDISAYLDFEEKLWHPLKSRKKKLPRRVYCRGNHDQRINIAIDKDPVLIGTIGTNDLKQEEFYDEVIDYVGNTPGTICIDSVLYAHYFVSGVLGKAISGEHPAYTLLSKKFTSCTQGHTHTLDWCIRNLPTGRTIQSLVVGVYQDYESPWAGEMNKLWNRGVVIKRNVEEGQYDLEWISISNLKKEYGGNG